MNLAEIRTTVQRRLGIRDTDRFFSPDEIDAAINRGQEKVDSEHNWTWLSTSETFTLAAGDYTNVLPTNWLATKAVFYRGEGLTVMSEAEWRYRLEGQTGSPRGYYIDSANLYLAPQPNASVTIDHSYYKWSPPLADDNDEPLVPKPWRQVLVWAAIADLAANGPLE
jgi:hypothetical protein